MSSYMGSLFKASFGILEGRYSSLNLFASQKTCGFSYSNPRLKGNYFAHILIEVDLNNRLPDSMEICMGTSSWIQQQDYENLPFRCIFFHECGHLHHRCPKNKSPSLDSPGPPREHKGKAPLSKGLVDREGFIQVKSYNKGKGKKRTWMDRQTDGTFNKFNALGNFI